jgi:hypothetical protein
MENMLYYKAQNRYYEAALYYPTSILILKYAEIPLIAYIHTNDHLHNETLRYILKDYRFGLALYQYELENDKSLSRNCLEKIQQQINCLQHIYITYDNSYNDTFIPKDEILQCMLLGPNIFQYESYCK